MFDDSSGSDRVTCPACGIELAAIMPGRGAGLTQHICRGCGARLEVHYFWGELVEATRVDPDEAGSPD